MAATRSDAQDCVTQALRRLAAWAVLTTGSHLSQLQMPHPWQAEYRVCREEGLGGEGSKQRRLALLVSIRMHATVCACVGVGEDMQPDQLWTYLGARVDLMSCTATCRGGCVHCTSYVPLHTALCAGCLACTPVFLPTTHDAHGACSCPPLRHALQRVRPCVRTPTQAGSSSAARQCCDLAAGACRRTRQCA